MTRPKRMLAKGGRQSMWTRLLHGPANVGELMRVSASQENSVRTYMTALRTAGYIEFEDGFFTLVKATGSRAPSINMGAETLYDWNLEKQMEPRDLEKLWKQSGFSLTAFCRELGLGDGQGTRVRQMIDGNRPISPTVEAKALAFGNRQP